MKKRNGASINVGASSILVIFVLLSLTTFATLSLLSANADLRLSQKAEIASDNYWAACNQAERIVARVDEALSKAHETALPGGDYREAVLTLFAAGGIQAGVELSYGENDAFSFTVPVGETQELYVELTPEDSERHFRKTAWLLRSTVEWESLVEPLELWDGVSPDGLPTGIA